MPEEHEKQNEIPRNCLREFRIRLLKVLLWTIVIVVILAVLAGMILSQIGTIRPESVANVCKRDLVWADRIIRYYCRQKPTKEDDGIPRDSTVSGVIETIPSNLIARFFQCEKLDWHYPYLAFPVPVSVIAGESAGEPVPILMCSPDCFHAKANCGINVLYSDGSVRTIKKNEAEQLVSVYSPMPVDLERRDRDTTESKPVPVAMDTSEDAGVYVRRGDDLFFDKSRVNVLYSNGVFHDMDRNEAEKLFSENQPAEGK